VSLADQASDLLVGASAFYVRHLARTVLKVSAS